MMLDPKGREAARLWAINAASDGGIPGDDYIDGILTAYLSTVTPAEVGGLVERLRGIPVKWIDLRLGEEAADAIEAMSTALAAKAAELAGASERARMMLDAKNHWRDRAERAEAQLAEANKARNYLKDAVTVGLSDSEISRRAKLFIAACEAQGGE